MERTMRCKRTALAVAAIFTCAPMQFSHAFIRTGIKALDKELKKAEDTLSDATNSVGKLAEDLAGGAASIINGGAQTVFDVAGGVVSVIEKAGQGVITIAQRASGDTVATVEKAGEGVVTTVSKAGTDAVATYTKGWKDVGEQTRRSFDDTVEAGAAALRYQERILKDQDDVFRNAQRRLNEGKILDAAWHFNTEQLQSQEENFFKATQESSVINQAAASAAAVYGGPGGAAAYASWSTYKATGDASMAFRAGLAAGMVSQFGAGQPLPPANAPITEAVKRAALAGAAGGIAVAAQGGDEAAIQDAFLKSSGAVLIQTSKGMVGSQYPKVADAITLAECISAKDVDCVSRTTYVREAGKIVKQASGLPKVDSEAIDPKKMVGKWTGVDLNEVNAKVERAVSDISKLPDGKVIVLEQGRIVLTTTLGTRPNIDYGTPTVVVTSIDGGRPFDFNRTIGRKADLEKPSGNYDCKMGPHHRTIRTSQSGTSCITKYRREDGKVTVIWNTPSHRDACVPKAQAFVKSMAKQGMKCTAR